MFNFDAIMGRAIELKYLDFDPIINDPAVVESEVVLIVQPVMGYSSMLRYWQAQGQHHLVCAELNGNRTYTMPLTEPLANADWLDSIFKPFTDQSRTELLRSALSQWLAGEWKGVWFQRVSRHQIESNLSEVRGGCYRHCVKADGTNDWSPDDLMAKPVVEYWITHIPGEDDRMVALYSDDTEPMYFDGNVDWYIFTFMGPEAPDVTKEGVVETDFMVDIEASGNWTRMRTLYVEYLEIYDHNTGFEEAGISLMILKAVLCAAGRDITE